MSGVLVQWGSILRSGLWHGKRKDSGESGERRVDMGLYVHSLGEIPTSAERAYYVYLLVLSGAKVFS